MVTTPLDLPDSSALGLVIVGDDLTALNYETATEAAKRNGISRPLVKRLAREKRIPGAFKVGAGTAATWCIPTSWKHERKENKNG